VTQLTPADTELAAAMSALCTFDYLSGNFDRFSGGNIGMMNGNLLFIDNDGAFLVPQPVAAARANLALIQAVDHYSKALVERIAALTDEQLGQLLGADSEAELDAAQVAAVAGRRREFMRIFAQKRAALGDAVVFAFP
jgi:hypothetical protein